MLKNNAKNNKIAAIILTAVIGIIAISGFVAAGLSNYADSKVPGVWEARGLTGLILDIISIPFAFLFIFLLIKFKFYPDIFSSTSNDTKVWHWKKLILLGIVLSIVVIGLVVIFNQN